MKILLVAPEALPYCKSGGLGDFIWSYGKALVKEGQDTHVILPLYKSIRDRFPEVLEHYYEDFDFKMSWRTQGCGIFHVVNEGVNFWFCAMDRFDRDQLYGYGDDNERFACFMMAVNTFITRHNDFDVVHCNDWQTAVLPLLLRYNPCPIKTVLTIHNPAFQGWAKREDLSTYFNLDLGYYDSGFAKLGDSFNYLKTGVMAADKVNTVSETHARELMADHNSFGGLGAIIDWCRHNDFSGIVNGLDTDIWNPMTDDKIARNYGVDDYGQGKRANRDAIMSRLGIHDDPDGPLLAVVTRLSHQKGVDRIIGIMPLLERYHAHLIVIGTGEMEGEFLYHAMQYPRVYFVRRYDEALAHLLYAASDFFLMPSYFEPCGTSQMIAMRYGSVPIVSDAGGLNDTVKDFSVGQDATGFVFSNWLGDGCYNCTEAALRFYSQDMDRKNQVIQNGMRGEYGWQKSAKKYLQLYYDIFWKVR